MNTTLEDAEHLASRVRDGVVSGIECDVVLCPPFISLQAVRNAVAGSQVMVGAQNMYHESSGAFTGEIAPPMLQALCDYVVLGHSERRQLFGETDQTVNLKVKAALTHALRPILCVGETLEQRESGHAQEVIANQVRDALAGVEDITGLIVAYEPVWAIGTGQAATPETAEEIMGGAVKETLADLFGHAASDAPLLYGGSVNPGNAASFASQPNIHGGLVGGASLQADQFLEIVQAVAVAKG